MEQWKEFKRQKNGISFEISNLGNIRLLQYYKGDIVDSELLSIGHVLYCVQEYNNIRCYNVAENIYRIVYTAFNSKINKGYQIHHINFDHTDNRLNNLICLPPREHGKYHMWQSYLQSHSTLYDHLNDYDNINKKYIYELVKDYNTALDNYNNISNINYTIEDAARDYRLITNRFANKVKEISQNKKIKYKQEREQELINIRNNKINSGEYYLDNNGKLIKKNRQKWTDERRNKTMTTRYETVYNNPEWRDKVSKGVKASVDDDYRQAASKGGKNRWNKIKKK